jgi:hypothetical protein
MFNIFIWMIKDKIFIYYCVLILIFALYKQVSNEFSYMQVALNFF